jgi:pimeloyl-[acyl-carrier protein] methyl ester esterase
VSRVHVECSGSGTPLVMLHGWGLNLRVFDALSLSLSDSCHVLRLDLPGHGKSAWDPRAATLPGHAMLVRDELLARVPAPWILLGWSLGGQVALELAAAEPQRVERLVLIAATPRFVASHDWPYGMSSTALRLFAQRLTSDRRRTVSEFLELQVRGSAAGERVLRELQAALVAHGETGLEALAAGLASLAQTDLRRRLGAIVQPALVLAGQYDRITPPQASRALAERLPGGRYAEFSRAGHAPFLSHARAVATAVREFLS